LKAQKGDYMLEEVVIHQDRKVYWTWKVVIFGNACFSINGKEWIFNKMYGRSHEDETTTENTYT